MPISFISLALAALQATAALAAQEALVQEPYTSCSVSSVKATKRYKGNRFHTGNETRLRISNGAAGQSGLVGALAKAYIDYSRQSGIVDTDYVIDWIVGDTTDSINYLATGDADIAITYNAAAEYRARNLSIATARIYGFRDHFYLVGPGANPAKLTGPSSTKQDSIYNMFNKIVTTGNTGAGNPPTRFLSRYDKSATNIKESLLFAEIGQVPWAYAYSKWYHQYPLFPIPALTAASRLKEYSLTDRGTFLTLKHLDPKITKDLVVYKAGGDKDPSDPLLNPASVLLGKKICPKNLRLGMFFMKWMQRDDGGQKVVKTFKQPGSTEYLYTVAPKCGGKVDHCVGW